MIVNHETTRALERLVDAWSELELEPKALEPVHTAMRRRSELGREASAAATEADGALAVIARRVAAGELTFAEALTEHAAATVALDRVGTAIRDRRANLLAAAQSAAVRLALEALRDAGDVRRLIEDATAKLRADLGKLAPALEGVEDAEAAIAAGPKVGTAWRTVAELEGRRQALGRCWHALAVLDLVDDAERPPELGTTTALRLVRRMVAEAA